MADIRLALAALALAVVSGAAPAPDTPFRDLKPDTGWSEAVISVSDLDRSETYFREVAGWTVRSRGDTPAELLRYWGLPATARGRERLMCNPGDAYGCVRLIQFSGVAQRQARPGAQSWDTGGIYSLMTRSRDLRGAYDRSAALGYSAFSEPIVFDYRGVKLSNVVLRGPDGVNIAIYQRDAPPLTGWATIRRLSAPFNAMQMVRDRDTARDFYARVFGYGVLANAEFTDPAPGPNNFGMPANLVTTNSRRHAIMGIGVSGLADASGARQVELMQFVGLAGRDLSATARIPNYGIVALRFPTAKLDEIVRRAAEAGAQSKVSAPIAVPGWGRVRVADITGPDGTVNEAIEPVAGR